MEIHHAVLLRVSNPQAYLHELRDSTVHSAEIRREQLGIDDVRYLIEEAYRRPMGTAETQELIVMTNFITLEAQQALLKIIEEPPETTRFVFVIPLSLPLLDTLQSRFFRLTVEDTTCDSSAFLLLKKAPIAKRMELIDEATKSKNHAWQSDVKCGLIDHLAANSNHYSVEQLRSLQYVATTLLTRGASNKFLLEELALVLDARS
jgi:DNA polymerase III delta prime subunit